MITLLTKVVNLFAVKSNYAMITLLTKVVNLINVKSNYLMLWLPYLLK